MSNDIGNMDITITCKYVDRVEPYSAYKAEVTLDSADMTDFINDNQQEILDYIDEEEVIKWLEANDYTVEKDT